MKKVIVALDKMSLSECQDFLRKTNGQIKIIKIGMELFYKYGKESLQLLCTEFNVEVFLDLKIYDIPATAYGAVKSLEGLPIKFLTLHLQGGEAMLNKALEARNKYLPMCKLLGVSYLTSYSPKELESIWSYKTKEDQEKAFQRLFMLADQTGIDGVVCSAHEASALKNLTSKLIAVCPGIRFSGDVLDDQKRVMTPNQALDQGADYIVIGRSLTNNTSDLEVKLKVLNEIG